MAVILVIGASRGIGLETVRATSAAGHTVKAFARSAPPDAQRDPRVTWFSGDARCTSDVMKALIGVDTVILTLGMAVGARLLLGPIDLFSSATRVVVDAMQQSGVGRLICVTGYGAGDGRAHMTCLERVPFELFLGRAYSDKDIQETIIKQSPLDWVIARPGILTNGPRSKAIQILREPSTWRNGFISRADVADFLVAQVADDTFLRTTPVLIG